MLNIFRHFLFYSIFGLIALSLVCIVNALRQTCPLDFDLSPEGFNVFFKPFSNYKDVFSLTFTIIGIYLVIEQIKIASFANKITSRVDWRNKLETKLKDIKNVAISDYIESRTNDIFDFLIENNSRLKTKSQLTEFFKQFLDDKIEDFEKGSTEFDKNKHQYDSEEKSYSYDDILKIRNSIVDNTLSYNEFPKDFKDLYFKKVKEFNKDKIIKKQQPTNNESKK